MTDISDRLAEAHRVSAPDLWPEIIERSQSAPPPREPERRILVVAVAVSVALAGVGFAVYALRPAPSSERTNRPGAVTSTPIPSEEACEFPTLRPESLPWLAAGDPVPSPEVVGEYKRVNWFGPEGTSWEGSYVSLRLLKEAPDVEGPAAPELPDGTVGVLLDRHPEWDVFWKDSTTYCGAVAMYVYLRPLVSDEARAATVEVAASLQGEAPAGPLESPTSG